MDIVVICHVKNEICINQIDVLDFIYLNSGLHDTIVRERLDLELEYSRVAVPFNGTYSPELKMPNHFHCLRIKTCAFLRE